MLTLWMLAAARESGVRRNVDWLNRLIERGRAGPDDLQHTRPHITGRTQQPETASPLPSRQPQPDPGAAMHHWQGGRITTARHTTIQPHR
ncbi:MAG TPA: hypothetical protein VFC19_18000 [Candidatus Limnocylindrales bacterium]|nr:hypothetical protein [Candidatus Limnocylindrales bacterium]